MEILDDGCEFGRGPADDDARMPSNSAVESHRDGDQFVPRRKDGAWLVVRVERGKIG